MPLAPKEKNQNICVAVRCRPLNSGEKSRGSCSVAEAGHNTVSVRSSLSNLHSTQKLFTYDHVFGPATPQINVYKAIVAPAVEEVMQGYNCTIFAYGQTGTGKTFTMEGERSSGDAGATWEDDPLAGIIPRALHQLFSRLGDQGCEFSVQVSFLEIYNEELIDLLGAESVENPRLKIYEDAMKKGSCVIQGLEEVRVHSKEEVYGILEKGTSRRQTAATLMNAHSSRSHSLFTVTLHIKENTLEGEELLKTGKLNLVDLAGSECVGRSGAVEKRAREAGQINQSLLTLGRVITALVDHTPHVPYRESKLTRLLQDSLGGRTKTSIIATISPASCCLEETLSTLEYAHRAKNILNKPEINQKLTKKQLLKEYTGEIERLRRDLQAARDKSGIFIANENYEAMEAARIQREQLIEQLENELKNTKEELDKMMELFDEAEVKLKVQGEELVSTQQELHFTSQELGTTKTHLQHSRRDAAQKGHLLEHHVKTEKQLVGQATQLLEVSKVSTSDNVGLHAKIDRKSAVEQHNEVLIQSFNRKSQDMFENMMQETKRHHTAHRQMADQLSGNLKMTLESTSLELKQSIDGLRALEGVIDKGVSRSGCLQQEFAANAAERFNASTELAESHEAGLVDEMKDFHLRVVKVFIQEEISKLLSVQGMLRGQLIQSNEIVQGTTRLVEDYAGLMQSRISEMEDMMQAAQDEREKHLATIQELQLLRQKQEDDTWQKFEENLQKDLQKSLALVRQQRLKDASEAGEEMERVAKETKEHKEARDLQQAGLRTTVMADSSEHVQTVTGQLKSLVDGLHTSSKTINVSIDTMREEDITGFEARHQDLQDKLSDMKQQNSAALKTKQDQHQQFLACYTNDFTSLNQEVLDSVKSNVSENVARHEKTSHDLIEDEARLHGMCEEADGRTAEWTEQHQKDLTAHGTLVQEYTENIATDRPTGQTPQRKAYVYPEWLAQSRRHSLLLQEFNQQLDEADEETEVAPAQTSLVDSDEKCINAGDVVTKDTTETDAASVVTESLNTSGDSAISAMSAQSSKSQSSNKENLMKPPTSGRAPRSVKQTTKRETRSNSQSSSNERSSKSNERLAKTSRLPLKNAQV